MDKYEYVHGKGEKRKIKVDLLPCPFCGSKAELSGRFPNAQYYITCTGCRVSLWYDREDKAIGAWNRRVGKPKLNKTVVVSSSTLRRIDELSEKIRKNLAVVEDYDEYERCLIDTGLFSKDEIMKCLTDYGFYSYDHLIRMRNKARSIEDKKLVESTSVVKLVAIGLAVIFSR